MRKCGKHGFLSSEATANVLDCIADKFLYHLCGLDLQQLRVSTDELRERREEHLEFLNKDYL